MTAIRNPEATTENPDENDKLPANVVNNYFSFGVDAQIALEFDLARKKSPKLYKTRTMNKFYYGLAGVRGILLKRKWSNLGNMIEVFCNGRNITDKIRGRKKFRRFHAIIFLNIPFYAGGTHPWNKKFGPIIPTTNDGIMEVIGLMPYQFPLLQVGKSGTSLAQCSSAKITTSKDIPTQVDGEAKLLGPSIIELSVFPEKAQMLQKGG